MKIVITGASGKTGFRIAEEALKLQYEIRLVIRPDSILPESLQNCEIRRINFSNPKEIDSAFEGSEALIIATGARPSVDLTGPGRVDACGVRRQVESSIKVGIKKIVLVSSLCAGRFLHPLNLFGLILLWKRIGEKSIESSGLDWTIIRPGGLTEQEKDLETEKVFYTKADMQQDASIPRRLVAKTCIEALKAKNAKQKIIEITSRNDIKEISLEKAIEGFTMDTLVNQES